MTAEQVGAVLIFYSSRNNPRIIDRYREAITYLKEEGVDAEVIDIDEDPRPAQEAGVVTTPTVIIQRGEEREKHIGITVGLADLLKNDSYGRSVLYQTGFETGRDMAVEESVAGASEASAVTAILEEFFAADGVGFELDRFDPERSVARVSLSPDESLSAGESRRVVHEQFEAFLGGFFTEVFDTAVDASEEECVKQGDAACRFVIEKAGKDG